MSNFSFLQTEWPEIYQTAVRVEGYVQGDSRTACFHARRALEQIVAWLYDHDPAFDRPYDDSLITLLNDYSFKDNTPYEIGSKAHFLRKLGNEAVHSSQPMTARDSLIAVKELYHLLYWLARTYTKGDPAALPNNFDETQIPPAPEKVVQQSAKQLQLLDDELSNKDQQLREQAERIKDFEAQLAALQAQTVIVRQTNERVMVPHDYNEAETRRNLIDLLLREAGWDPHGENVEEYKVSGMPNAEGIGYVDYVLWGDDGKPLGLVEAKKTSVSPKKGKQQAVLYANCLEQLHGQRPVIFYSNGYETWIWDDANYPERKVQGFYTKDELGRLIQRRTGMIPFGQVHTNNDIVDRAYQEEAIRSICDHFSAKHRRGLLVMATGTGKTRNTIALIDVLMRAGWIKRALFLADRQALVRQAVGAFKRHLPESNPINLLEDKEAAESRVVVSTYHTMMGMIDTAMEGDRKVFTPGHFDLVVIDEAHRSVYHKFGAIFDYFDSLLLGLTATPKDEVDRNTYSLFNMPDGVPVFSYDLDQAVSENYLVPLRAMTVPVKFQQEGIKYDDLSDEEKLEWDLIDWGDEENKPDHINPTALNAWLFNQDTVDKVLEHLMRHGIKVKGGDRLGKTIIFAKNHKHAEFIEERFDCNYPHLAGKFARVIDTYQTYTQSLIDDFSKPAADPHIAISVDMLDTGIDVPEIVNLVFFKTVRSKTKFWQMIGRGTRLSPDLFGLGQDKEEFVIFDYCGNFEFFNQNPEGYKSQPQEPISQRIFKLRLDLLELYREDPGEGFLAMASELADVLHGQVTAIPKNNFIVRPKLRWVEKFDDRSAWDFLTKIDLADLDLHISGLPTTLPEDDESALQFDYLMLQMQKSWLQGEPLFDRLAGKVVELAQQLGKSTNIPMVQAEAELIHKVQDEAYWESVEADGLEDIRRRFRDLTQFVKPVGRGDVYTHFVDQIGLMQEAPSEFGTSGVNLAQYRKRVEKFLRSHKDERVIRKIRFAMPLSADDLDQLEEFFFQATETGSREDFVNAYGESQLLPVFIRSLVGMDRAAAKEAFSQYLDEKIFNADQIRFVNFIIEHLVANGSIDERLLYEQPYTDIHYQGIDGLFPNLAEDLIGVIRRLNRLGLT